MLIQQHFKTILTIILHCYKRSIKIGTNFSSLCLKDLCIAKMDYAAKKMTFRLKTTLLTLIFLD